MEKSKFYVKIIGIIFDPTERKILIGKNKGDKFFSFLEGNLKNEEDLDVGLKRVTTEKTGYVVHNLGAVFAENHIEQELEALKLYFLCEATEGEEKLAEQVEEIKWIKAHEFEDLTNKKLPIRLHEYIFSIAG